MVDLTKPYRIDGEGVNGRRAVKYYCGAVFVPEGYEYTRRYETAAWYTILRTTEGRWYPVFATRDHIYGTKWTLTARVQATIASEHTPSMFGGVAYGKEPQGLNHKNVGRQDEFVFSVSPSMIGIAVGDIETNHPRFYPVTLGFSAMRNFYTHSWEHRSEIHWSDSWEWVPYNPDHIKKLTPLSELRVEKYGHVVLNG